MKKILALILAGLLGLALALPAFADDIFVDDAIVAEEVFEAVVEEQGMPESFGGFLGVLWNLLINPFGSGVYGIQQLTEISAAPFQFFKIVLLVFFPLVAFVGQIFVVLGLFDIGPFGSFNDYLWANWTNRFFSII